MEQKIKFDFSQKGFPLLDYNVLKTSKTLSSGCKEPDLIFCGPRKDF